jgi:hypothetical protein
MRTRRSAGEFDRGRLDQGLHDALFAWMTLRFRFVGPVSDFDPRLRQGRRILMFRDHGAGAQSLCRRTPPRQRQAIGGVFAIGTDDPCSRSICPRPPACIRYRQVGVISQTPNVGSSSACRSRDSRRTVTQSTQDRRRRSGCAGTPPRTRCIGTRSPAWCRSRGTSTARSRSADVTAWRKSRNRAAGRPPTAPATTNRSSSNRSDRRTDTSPALALGDHTDRAGLCTSDVLDPARLPRDERDSTRRPPSFDPGRLPGDDARSPRLHTRRHRVTRSRWAVRYRGRPVARCSGGVSTPALATATFGSARDTEIAQLSSVEPAQGGSP